MTMLHSTPPTRRSGQSADDSPRDSTQAFFARVGRMVVRFRYLVVLAWFLIVVGALAGLPTLSSVTNSNNNSFLPSGQPSVRAARLAAPFQRGSLPQALLVASRDGERLTPTDNTAITRAEAVVRRVRGVVEVRDQGVSRDGQARKALITLVPNALGDSGQTYVDTIRGTFKRGAPTGVALYLTGDVATTVDSSRSSSSTALVTEALSIVLILVLLFVVYRAVLAPFLTLIPPAIALITAGPIIAVTHSLFGVAVSDPTQLMLIVLLLGAGTDYGLFFAFRMREELRGGLAPHAAVIKSLSRVGETITFSAGTVIAALLCLLLASFAFYQGLGPAMAIGVGIMLLAGLTLLPAVFAIAGRAAFWPSSVQPGTYRASMWARITAQIVERPAAVLLTGVVLFAALAGYGLATFSPSGFSDTAAAGQAARGTRVLDEHFPAAQANPTYLLLRYPESVWQEPGLLVQAMRQLSTSPVFTSISGPLDPNGTPLTGRQLKRLHRILGPAANLPSAPPAGVTVSDSLYNAYRATAQFLSADGRTVQLDASLAAGAPSNTRAMRAIPRIRAALIQVAHATGAAESGVAGQAAFAYDISSLSTGDLVLIIPVVLLVIGVLLALVLRSLVAPWYLLASVGLSYLAALGLAVLVFLGIGGSEGLNFFLPFLMFVFLMALGSDYNILVMTRIREEAQDGPLPAAVVRAVGATGGTVTSAGIILAGSFLVLTLAGGSSVQQTGFAIAGGILIDTFLVRTLFIPSAVVLLGRWNWWPARLTAEQAPARRVA